MAPACFFARCVSVPAQLLAIPTPLAITSCGLRRLGAAGARPVCAAGRMLGSVRYGTGAALGAKEADAEVAAVPPSVPVRVAYELQLAGHRYLDVRTEGEFGGGHPAGAVNIPYMHITGSVILPARWRIGAINYDGRDHPLLAVQVTDLTDGVFVGFSYNHALSDGTAFWGFINAWAGITRARLLGSPREQPLRRPLLDRWSRDGGAAAPVVLPCAEVSDLIERTPQTPLRERMLHFSSESLVAFKERARQELLATGDAQGAASLTRFQALTSLLWRCITRARRLSPGEETTCRAAINNRGRLRPQLQAEYFGNAISTISTDAVRAPGLLERGHGWAAAAVGRAVAAHTDASIRERVTALTAKPPAKDPPAYMMSWHDPCGTLMGSSPRFDMFGCDFGWGKPVAARSGKANKVDGSTSLYPCPDGEGGMDAELTLTPEHMAALEEDEEFWAAVSPDAPAPVGKA